MATTTNQFPNPTLISGSKRQLTSAGVATASNTKATQAALAVGTLTIQWTPEATTAAAATLPASSAVAWNNIGWETSVALDSLGDGGTTRASNVTVIVSLTAGTAGTVGTYVILYINGVEIGRSGLASTAIATSATAVGVLVPITAGIAFTAGAKLQMAVYSVLPANVGINPVTYTFNYGTSAATGTNIAPVTYSISALRTASESTSQTDSTKRTIAISQTASDATTSTDAGTRVSMVFRRSTEAAESQADTASRVYVAPRTGNESQTSTQAASRVTATIRRTASESETEIDTAFRAITKSITITDVSPTELQTASKILTFGRGTREYFQPTDGPITVPTKRISGTVYLRADGSRYLGGATVTLIRDSDGLECANTTSSVTDGTYSFVRDAFDTNTYTTRIKRQVVGATPEEAVSQSGLVPA